MAKMSARDRRAGDDRDPEGDYEPPAHKQVLAAAPSWFVPPPYGWRHPVTGRRGWQPDPLLIAFGQYVKRGRYLANMTQRRLAAESGVDQGQISRLERALSPWTKVERLVKLSEVLGRALPLGYCPHEHWCSWQPAPPPPPEKPIDWLPENLRGTVFDPATFRDEPDE